MKKIIAILLLSSTLSGCAAIATVKAILPKDHDPGLVSGWVDLQIGLDKVQCTDKNTLLQAQVNADWLNRYAEFRNDPQKVSTKAIVDNLNKAQEGNEAVCQRWVNLSKTRMKIIQEAWSGR